MKTLGDRIKFHRKRMGLTQEQLAERMGVSPQAVSKWEHNQSCPDITVLPTLAQFFGISVDELLGNEEPQAEVIEEEDDDSGYNFHWEWHPNSLLLPIYVIVVGSLLLFNHFMGFDISWWTVLWTTGLTYIGLTGLTGGFSFFSTMLILGGAYFLLSAYDLFSWSLSWSIVLPIALLLWGISLLIDSFTGKSKAKRMAEKATKATAKKKRDYYCNDGQIHCDLSFGEHRLRVVTPVLTGGLVDTSFGNFTVDLSGCENVAPGCTLSIDNSFANLILLVPKRFVASIVEDDNFAANAQFRGSPDANPQGSIRILLDNSFGNFSISYIDT